MWVTAVTGVPRGSQGSYAVTRITRTSQGSRRSSGVTHNAGGRRQGGLRHQAVLPRQAHHAVHVRAAGGGRAPRRHGAADGHAGGVRRDVRRVPAALRRRPRPLPLLQRRCAAAAGPIPENVIIVVIHSINVITVCLLCVCFCVCVFFSYVRFVPPPPHWLSMWPSPKLAPTLLGQHAPF